MKKQLACALLVAALATTHRASAEVFTVIETNTVGSVTYTTKWTYDLDIATRTAKLLRGRDLVGDVTLKNLIVADAGGDILFTVASIAEGALANNPALLSCSVPNTMLEIGAYAFSNCTALSSATLDEGVRYVGERAFMNTILTQIELPATLLDMGGNISAGTLFTDKISIGDSSHFKYSGDEVLYNRDMTKLYACPTRAEGTVTIPNTVTNIAADAFFGCHRLSYLNIPATVNTIGSGAFNVGGIWPGLSAPESTPKLKSVFFNGPPPNAADEVFKGAPEDLEIYAFTDEWADIPEWQGRKVNLIDAANPPILSFLDATGITWHYRIMDDSVEIYNEDPDGNPAAAVSPVSTSGIAYRESEDSTTTRKALKVPDAINGYAVTKIGAHAFDGCKALVYVGLPSSVREIGDGAFRGCASIVAIGASEAIPFATADNTIALPRGVTKLGNRPFEGVQASAVSFPYTLSETDGNPVAGCEYVSSISVDADCPAFTVSEGVMYDKSRKTIVSLPPNGSGESFAIPDSVAAIGKEAFAGCRFLKEMTIPADVVEIGSAAFTGCNALAKVTYDGDAPNAPDDLYDGTPENLVSYASESASGFTAGTWKNRTAILVPLHPDQTGLVHNDGTVKWTYDIIDGKAVITDAEGDVSGSVVTIPSTLPDENGNVALSRIDPEALDGLEGVASYDTEATALSVRKGCVYSADGTTLIRVPSSFVLPYKVTTEVSSNTVTVTIIPGIKESGNPGNDGTSITTNITSIASSSPTTRDVPGDISFETLLSGVTTIADHAFFGCNRNLTNESFTVSEILQGETGFAGTGGKPYVRTSSQETTTTLAYSMTLTLPSSVTTVGERAFEGSGLSLGGTGSFQGPVTEKPQSQPQETGENAQLEESTCYIGWIERNGKAVGSVTLKTGRTRNGEIPASGNVIRIGEKKSRIKNKSELTALEGVKLVKDLSKSKSAAEKAVFDRFNGKRWTLAFCTFDSTSAPLLGGYTTISVGVQAKGKVRIQGTAADGTKISSSAQMVVDEGSFKIPVAAQLYSGKRGGFAAVFTVTEAGEISVEGDSVEFTAIANGQPVRALLLPFASSPHGSVLSGDILIWGAADDGYIPAENPGWRPRYAKSSGLFKGSVYLKRASDGKRVRATVNGAVVDGIGYGAAVIKNTASWRVEVAAEFE